MWGVGGGIHEDTIYYVMVDAPSMEEKRVDADYKIEIPERYTQKKD